MANKYVLVYYDLTGEEKVLKDRSSGKIRKFKTYEGAHRLKVWFDKQGYDSYIKIEK